ncbi:hypothetical protein WR25_09474 [Diploscapter pachys]|uniref:K Homology domain-containing protein n=1 Tax=Diploscapter pachys TaxID=2018661 RepID=A0A2A2LN19_9BILA|nr:hypothetical protein WR25_09474 [Diploscapter pachys]
METSSGGDAMRSASISSTLPSPSQFFPACGGDLPPPRPHHRSISSPPPFSPSSALAPIHHLSVPHTPRFDRITSTRLMPEGMHEFLASPSGQSMIHMLETNLLITVQFDEARCLITHLAHLTAEPVFEHIVDKFHDVQFEKAMRISMLRAMCPHNVSARFGASQAQLIAFHAPQIVRDSNIVEIIIEPSGQISWYGNAHTVATANLIVSTIMYTVLGNEVGREVHEVIQRGCSLGDRHGLLEEGILKTGTQQLSSFAVTNIPPVTPMRRRFKERMIMFVKSTSAPRLIGSRGVNKKKIESANNCCIILHTENKNEHMEFPVEIFAQSAEDCEKARDYIDQFLNDPNAIAQQEKSNKNSYVPIIRLEHSPRKSSTSSIDKTTSL